MIGCKKLPSYVQVADFKPVVEGKRLDSRRPRLGKVGCKVAW
jgi:hypothetical protein